MRRVVVTGLGMVTPLGNDVKSTWEAALAGKSGIDVITTFDTESFSVTFGGAIKNLNLDPYVNAKEAKKMDPFIHYGLVAASQAVEDSGLVVTEDNAPRIGTMVSAGIGGIESIENQVTILHEKGPRRISPFFVPMSIINMISGNLSIKYGFKGPNLSMVTACASGTHSIGDSYRLIQAGDADVMVAGGAEKALTPLGLGGFAAARALSTRNDDPQTASRPWDKDRDGFVLSDGAGAVVLEEYEHAKARGATIYGEIIGYGMSGDAHHMTLPSPGGVGASMCMDNALRNAKVNPEQVQYVSAHGTSTPAGDLGETDAVKRTFKDHANQLMVSSVKSMIGHSLGAAGAIETVFALLTLQHQVIPPTINLNHPGDGCDLDYVPHTARDVSVEIMLNNSFGFGGTNGTLVLKRI